MNVMDKETNIDLETGMHGVGTLKAPATTQDMCPLPELSGLSRSCPYAKCPSLALHY
jgi:hypothetical protein